MVTSPLLDPVATLHGISSKCLWNNKHTKKSCYCKYFPANP